MKLKSLCAVALTAIMLAPVGVQAAEKTLAGEGEVTLQEPKGTNDNRPDPEEDGKEVETKDPDDGTDNVEGGPISIDFVAKLKFGTQDFDPSKTNTFAAEPIEVNQIDPATGAKTDGVRGPWVQWSDRRAGSDHTYSIKAALTKQFTHATSNRQLAGSTISYSNGLLRSEQEIGNWPTNKTVGDFTVAEDAQKQLVFDNSASTGNQGIGTWTAEFGQSDDWKDDKAGQSSNGNVDNSVFLNIPGQSYDQGIYKAEITWTIEYAP